MTLLALGVAGICAVSSFQHGEGVLESFCRDVREGEALTAVESRATARGLTAKRRAATGPLGPSVSITTSCGWLAGGSFCSVYHDGQAVTLVSHNPWYH